MCIIGDNIIIFGSLVPKLTLSVLQQQTERRLGGSKDNNELEIIMGGSKKKKLIDVPKECLCAPIVH
jgi:hypothetical protein